MSATGVPVPVSARADEPECWDVIGKHRREAVQVELTLTSVQQVGDANPCHPERWHLKLEGSMHTWCYQALPLAVRKQLEARHLPSRGRYSVPAAQRLQRRLKGKGYEILRSSCIFSLSRLAFEYDTIFCESMTDETACLEISPNGPDRPSQSCQTIYSRSTRPQGIK